MESDPSSDPRWAAQRLAAVRSMSALVGHQARNRLTVVRGALELLDAGCAGDLTAEQCAAFLAEMDRFLEDFNLGLEMMRCRLGEIRPVSAWQVIGDAVNRWRPSATRVGVRLELADPPGEDDTILADAALLRQAILNLLRNGTTAVAGRPDGRILIRSVRGQPWQIQIEDNGPGLPSPLPEGVGLVLCRDALTLMGGTLSYGAAANGSGAVFTLSLRAPIGERP
jgi:signal transduction histidine kinase